MTRLVGAAVEAAVWLVLILAALVSACWPR
jgi:hypothetical protein